VLQTISKLPWIGDIPILGQLLFSSRSTKKTNTELLVLITPHFVKPMTPDQKEKMLDFPINFLPTAEEAKAKKDGGKKGVEFVGPRGEQEPKP
jgi:pilus assembly protein CpaC